MTGTPPDVVDALLARIRAGESVAVGEDLPLYPDARPSQRAPRAPTSR